MTALCANCGSPLEPGDGVPVVHTGGGDYPDEHAIYCTDCGLPRSLLLADRLATERLTRRREEA